MISVRRFLPSAIGRAMALLGVASVLHAETNRQHAVELSAVVQESPAQIQLVWPSRADATEYRIFRRVPGDPFWGSALLSVTVGAATSTGATDATVSPGQLYEYRVQCFTSTVNATASPATVTAYGFCWAGIKTPAVESRGTAVLLVDATMAPSLSAELTRFARDLAGDGWKIIRHDVPRHEVGTPGWKEAVLANRSLVLADKAADPAVSTVILIGHVPVPYSGLNTYPDGHTDHEGAWPADVYYGELDGTWSDIGSNQNASRAENKNAAGDGKFDQTLLPSDIDLMVGRIDLANLPAFSESEAVLLRRYFDKNHAFRQGQIATQRRGLIDANFGSELTSKHSAAAFRSFSALFGPGQITQGDFLGTLASQPHLFAYGDGAGSYTSCAGVAASSDFPGANPRAIFTSLFGSYFGDWDNANNLLRSALASPGDILTAAWNGRPYWNFHPMGMGETIGYVTRLAQNNTPNVGYQSPNTSVGVRQIHTALMGDPTLRMHPVKPVTNLNATFDSGGVQLAWNASTDSGIVGYHVYRASSASGPYLRLTGSTIDAATPSGTPSASTTYTDPVSAGGDYFYLVRAVKLEASATGSYFNLSQGTFVQPSPAPTEPPSAPSGLTATVNSYSQITVTWTDTSDTETGFQLERSPNGSTSWTQIAAPGANSTSHVDAGLAATTPYFYRIRAINQIGNSAYSATANATTLAAVQLIAQPFADANGTTAASLGAITGVTSSSGVGSVQTSATLSYPGVLSSGRGFATAGGRFFLSLNTSLPALSSYVANGRIGGSGSGVLYVSWLARGINAGEANAIEFRTGTSADSNIVASVGTTFGNNFIRALSASALNGGIVNYNDSNLAPSSGTDLYVAKFTFGPNATTRIDVFVNQTTEGSPSVTTTGFAQFNVIGFAKFGSASAPAIDEIRFAATYADAVPLQPAAPAPTISSVSPSSGPAAGSSAVTLSGADFTGATSVTFAGVPATSLNVVNSTTITVATPPGSPGPVTIAVTTPAGTGSLPNAFTYLAPSGLAAFRSAHGLPADGSQDTAAPAGDGVKNLLKYAFHMIGSAPGQTPDLATPNATVVGPTGSSGLPRVDLAPATGRLQLTYVRRKAASNPGITYAVEFAPTPAADTFTVNASATESVTSLDATFERVTVTDSVPPPARRFARVRVTSP